MSLSAISWEGACPGIPQVKLIARSKCSLVCELPNVHLTAGPHLTVKSRSAEEKSGSKAQL